MSDPDGWRCERCPTWGGRADGRLPPMCPMCGGPVVRAGWIGVSGNVAVDTVVSHHVMDDDGGKRLADYLREEYPALRFDGGGELSEIPGDANALGVALAVGAALTAVPLDREPSS